MIGKGFQENVSVEEEMSASGVQAIIHFQGDELIIEHRQDMERILAHVQEMRERNEGKRWGEGKEVGHIPDLFYGKIKAIKDRAEREKAVYSFFRENPAFCAYPAFLKR